MRRAFTLIELLVVIGIMGLLGTASVGGYQQMRRGMEEQGVTVFVLSNGRRPARSRRFCEGFVPYISHASKPWPKNFRRAMQRCGASPWETVIIGDQIFTDVWGGHNAGIRACIYVRAIALDSLPRLLRYGIEAPFRMACLLRGERF